MARVGRRGHHALRAEARQFVGIEGGGEPERAERKPNICRALEELPRDGDVAALEVAVALERASPRAGAPRPTGAGASLPPAAAER
jgi:hypothetical protein